MNRNVCLTLFLVVLTCAGWAGIANAQSDEERKALLKAQDPLADVRAIMTDNTIAFGNADGKTSYGFQIQPVYSIPTEQSFNFIARGVIPIIGAPQDATMTRLDAGRIGGSGHTWGLSDVFMQGFIVPKTDSGVKFGFGPQVSLRTRTDNVVGGPGWGAGLAGVVFASEGDLSYGGILGHHWGQDSFSLTTMQPIVFYNTNWFGKGSYVGHNNQVTYNWAASDSDRWQVPLGLTTGKTFIRDDGHMIDVNIGAYGVPIGPKGGPDMQIKFGFSWFLP